MITTLHLIGIIQGLIVGFILFFIKRKEDRPFHYLALFLVLLSLAICNESLASYFDDSYHYLYPFNFYFLLPNLVLLHVYGKINKPLSTKRLWLNFAPGIVEFLIYSLELIAVRLQLLDPNDGVLYYYHQILPFLIILYVVSVQVLILKEISLYNSHIFKYLSTVNYKYLNWLKWVCLLIIFNELYFILYYLFSNDAVNDDLHYIVYVILETVLIYYISIGALLQFNLDDKIQLVSEVETASGLSQDKYLPSSDITNDHSIEHFKAIESYMKTHKPYLNPSLNLNSLSQIMAISSRLLSNAINEQANKNFYTYINHYRVEEVKNKLNDAQFANYSIEGIGKDAGFNSKSSFYTNFKKVTSVSPTEYVKTIS